MVTIKDIANRMGLHFTTVSKALRDHPDISNETKEKIAAVAEEMDYHPDSVAKSFKNRKSRTIGVIVPLIGNDFFASVISGIEEVIYDAGYTLMICQSNENVDREALHVSTMVSNQVAGVLIAVSKETTAADHLNILQRRDIKLVFFDRFLEHVNASRVVVDDYKGAFTLVDHLVKTGHKKIAHFSGSKGLTVSKSRLHGYVDALKKHDIPIDDELIIYGGFRESYGVGSFQQLMSKNIKPDAIFCVNDVVAVGAYQAIKSHGFHIPRDIAVAGFGNNTISSYLDPPLTTVKQSPHLIGKNAAQIIIKEIEQKNSEPKEKILDTELFIRQSTQMAMSKT